MAVTNYVCTLTPLQIGQLHELLTDRGWEFKEAPYAHWRASKGKTNVVAYTSGKLTVQGKETEEFVQFLLEPEVLQEARMGYEKELKALEDPKMFEPHAGIDESGKGDFFGPLIVACVYTDEAIARKLLDAGVADSKTITTDAKIVSLAATIRKVTEDRCGYVIIGPEAYNRMYDSFRNLNRLLAWGHAKALENLLDKVPDCPRAISDQFAKSEATVKAALMERGRRIVLEQHPRAEADVAVAAASILARCEFVKRMKLLGDSVGMELPRGSSAPSVKETAKKIAANGGAEALSKVAKMHFKTAAEVL